MTKINDILTDEELRAITALDDCLDPFKSSRLSLFADNGTLIVLKDDKYVVYTFPGVDCDGGDPDRAYDEDGNEIIVR